MGLVKDETGNTYGLLTVVEYLGIRKTRAFWKTECSCGNTLEISGKDLRNGHTKSCGCLRVDSNRARKGVPVTHGRRNSSEYGAWRAMKKRCLNPNHAAYGNYGGRGILIAPEWINSFEAFYRDVGPRPGPAYSLDRRDNDGNYTKENCRWATRLEQQNNRRSNIVVVHGGEDLTLTELGRKFGASYPTSPHYYITRRGCRCPIMRRT